MALLVAAGAAALVLVLEASCAHTATLTVRGTAPTQDNAGTCSAPSLSAMGANPALKVFASWTGPVSGLDSLTVAPGQSFSFSRTVPPGTYAVRAWAADAGGAGCDTSLTVTVKNAPWRPQLAP